MEHGYVSGGDYCKIVVHSQALMHTQGIVGVADWPECQTVDRVDSSRVVGGKPSELEQCYYISSRGLSAEEPAMAARWSIENRRHWMPDVNFGEDGFQVEKDNARGICLCSRRSRST